MNLNSSWPHAPCHCFSGPGTYMITASTMYQEHFFKKPEDLDYLQATFFSLAEKYRLQLEAWVLFSNHYHYIGKATENQESLRKFITHFHANSARDLNKKYGQSGRRIWYQCWDTRITYTNSYYARLNYVMTNPVRHGLVEKANQYKWCSAHWFEENAEKPYFRTVTSFKTDKVNVYDDFNFDEEKKKNIADS